MAEDVKQLVLNVMKKGLDLGASDIFFCTGEKPRIRLHGQVSHLEDQPIFTTEMLGQYLKHAMNEKDLQDFQSEKEINFAMDVPDIARFRVNVFWHLRGFSIVMRYIPTDIPVFDELGLPEPLKKIPHFKNGLVLVTGATGSGKSTTLACLVDIINKEYKKHIITIEDPIEFIHHNQTSFIEQREVGEHTLSFQNALNSTLREAADVVLLGEMRSLETISMAITAAEMGSLVFGTVHTNGAVDTINRIIDVFPAEQQNQIRQQLASSLRAVVWQTLIPKKDGGGRIAAFETMFKNYAVSSLIRDQKTHQIKSMMQVGSKEGMFTMEKYLFQLVQEGFISMEAAMEAIPENTDDFEALFNSQK